jgi:N6-adenosine-specific RNA methylase IME4
MAVRTGYLFRSAAEVLLVFRRGDPPAWRSKSERNLWVAPIREHSRKPDQVRAMIDRAVAPSPRLELFAREAAAGWDRWGDQADRFTEGG